MTYAFIDEHRARWRVATMCRVLRVARSGFYAWRRRPPSARQARREALTVAIRRVHAEHRQVYGSPRVHRALRQQGYACCRNSVARRMREAGIRVRPRRAFVPRTTDGGHGRPVAANVLSRDFAAGGPDQKWVADITYVATGEGWLYVAGVLDCYSRKLVGWAMSAAMPGGLVVDALNMALLRRAPAGELVHHSDRGSQYAGEAYRRLLANNGLTASMSGRGDCWDNAMMESFWATLKAELVHRERYATREQARASIFEYVEVFYNRQRLHSALGYQSPESFEASQKQHRPRAH